MNYYGVFVACDDDIIASENSHACRGENSTVCFVRVVGGNIFYMFPYLHRNFIQNKRVRIYLFTFFQQRHIAECYKLFRTKILRVRHISYRFVTRINSAAVHYNSSCIRSNTRNGEVPVGSPLTFTMRLCYIPRPLLHTSMALTKQIITGDTVIRVFIESIHFVAESNKKWICKCWTPISYNYSN